MFRKSIRAAALGTVAALALTACAGQGSGGVAEAPADDTATQAAPEGATRLVLWHGMTGPDGPAVTQIIEDFNLSQNEVFVEENVMPWDVLHQRLLTSITAPDGPQIVAMSSSDLAQYAAIDAFAPMDDFWDTEQWMDTSVLPASVREAGTVDGVTYSAPLNIAPMMLYWNKGMFEAAGLDPQTPPATWEEFAEAARALTVDENGDGINDVFGFALADNNTIPIYQMLMWGAGGGIVSQDGAQSLLASEESIEALEFWVSLVRDEQLSQIGLGGADADNLFRTERAAMQIVGPWMTTAFTEAGIDFGLAAPPAGPRGQVTLLDTVGFSINARADEAQRDAAKQFFAYWNSVESQITWADGSGFPPTRMDVPADSLANPFSAAFGAQDLLENSKVFLAGVPAGRAINTEIFEPALQRVLNGQGEVRDVFTAASAEVQARLDQE